MLMYCGNPEDIYIERETALEMTLELHLAMLEAPTERTSAILEGLLSGQTQREIAATLGISPSLISKGLREAMPYLRQRVENTYEIYRYS